MSCSSGIRPSPPVLVLVNVTPDAHPAAVLCVLTQKAGGAAAGVSVEPVLTGPPVVTRLRLTLVDVHGAVLACNVKRKTTNQTAWRTTRPVCCFFHRHRPANPGWHWQTYPAASARRSSQSGSQWDASERSKHSPPFWHGRSAHSSMSTSQFGPSKPGEDEEELVC